MRSGHEQSEALGYGFLFDFSPVLTKVMGAATPANRILHP